MMEDQEPGDSTPGVDPAQRRPPAPPPREGEAQAPKTEGQAAPGEVYPPTALEPRGRVAGLAAWYHGHKTAALLILFLGVTIPIWVGQKFSSRVSRQKQEKVAAEAAREAAEAIPVNVIEVKLGRFQDSLTALGTIAGGSEIDMRFEVDGTIESFNFREGDRVKKGDIIARVSAREAKLKLERARLELSQYEKLYALGGIAKSRVEEARLGMELAQSEFEKTMLKAPRGGIIGDKSAEVGEFVTPARKIVTLVSIEEVVVRVGIIEKNIDKVYPGQPVLVTVDTYPGTVFEGKVDNISPLVQGTSKTLSVEARLKNEGGLLLPGMFARTKIITYSAENALIIPNDSLVKTSSGFQVFVVDKENKASLRDVEVGYVANEFTQVVNGLTPGELVVVQKPQELRAGSTVKVIEVQQ